jgi:hypothetical protein
VPSAGVHADLVHRLIPQIQRVLEINELRTVTREVGETARERLSSPHGLRADL